MQTKIKTDTGRSTNGTTSSIRNVKRPRNYVMADDTKQSMSRTITKPQTNRVANTVKRVGGAVGEAVMGAVTGGTSKRSLINQIAETRTPKVQESYKRLDKTMTPNKPKAVTGSIPESERAMATRKATRNSGTYTYRGK